MLKTAGARPLLYAGAHRQFNFLHWLYQYLSGCVRRARVYLGSMPDLP